MFSLGLNWFASPNPFGRVQIATLLKKAGLIGKYNLAELRNLDLLENNVRIRKHDINISKIKCLIKKIERVDSEKQNTSVIEHILEEELRKLPNDTHPYILGYNDQAKEIDKLNSKPEFSYNALDFTELARKNNIFQMDHLTNLTGHKSYYLFGALAQMEVALIEFTLRFLKHKFKLISVPDILPKETIEGCGMSTTGSRSQVYLLDSGNCLSGTSEMALANYFSNTVLNEKDMPIRLSAVSRCYRAETSGLLEEKSIFRVHQFTKVEMFAVCVDDNSEEVLQFLKNTQSSLFEKLGIHIKVLEMPPSELGSAAYHKYDIEAWMPGKNMWGEISSSSNCTNYQGIRLNIQYRTEGNVSKFVHTVNGTGAAIPRLLIALFESYQLSTGNASIAQELQIHMRSKCIERDRRVPEVKFVKQIKSII